MTDRPTPSAGASQVPLGADDSAAGEEDRLLHTLTTDLRRERQERPLLLDDLQRLRRQLARTQLALERTQAELTQALRMSRSDALTGLPNRRGFDRPSRRVLAEHGDAARPLALLFIDLDGFKAVNDRLGHHAGDELLRVVGARLAHAVREGDLVCRHGGDEFLCLLPQVGQAERAAAVAAELLKVIAAPCEIGGQRVSVTASIGVALYPRDGRTVGELMRAADAAMYAAKAQGNGLCANARSGIEPGPTV